MKHVLFEDSSQEGSFSCLEQHVNKKEDASGALLMTWQHKITGEQSGGKLDNSWGFGCLSWHKPWVTIEFSTHPVLQHFRAEPDPRPSAFVILFLHPMQCQQIVLFLSLLTAFNYMTRRKANNWHGQRETRRHFLTHYTVSAVFGSGHSIKGITEGKLKNSGSSGLK